MQRRAWLKLSGLLLASRLPLAQATRPQRILVIGAGIAGLAAANQLQRAGHAVEVLEARERIGGRIHTSRSWPDAPMDLGASWINGFQTNPLGELTRSIGVRTVLTSYDNSIAYGRSGQVFSAAEEQHVEQLRLRIERVLAAAQDGAKDQSLQAAVEAGLDWDALGAVDQRLVDLLLNSIYEHEYAGSTREMSAWWWDDDGSFEGGDALFPEGFGAIPEHLAKGLSIRLGQVVQRIAWDDTGVRVDVAGQTLRADRVIVSVPLGVLKAGAIEFTPRLPSAKRHAIEALRMGVLNKCFLRFPRAFWPTEVDWIERVPERRGEWTEWVSFARPTGKPVLLGFNAADVGRRIESSSDRQIMAAAMRALRGIYGDDIPEPTGQQITRWASDPYTLGSYSFNAVGADPKVREDLAASIDGRVYFAGEATSRKHFATTHGAYLSGLRAAREVAG
ncbi:MAG TPA: NAD(P)/FAD-dependent oxidoreductase [Xanthomonadales bacterium]|nr:NAD(P)/FAD-dependent oxidoreductase [Xanthomonadales bacterium]